MAAAAPPRGGGGGDDPEGGDPRPFAAAPPAAPTAGAAAAADGDPAARRRVDVVVLMDLTGSMGPWLAAAKETTVAAVREYAATDECRLGVVGYRDYGDARRRELAPLTAQAVDVEAMLQPLEAVGGSDQAEDVAGGLAAAAGMGWEAPVRVLLHVGDAPPHGNAFHPVLVSDRYPRGDPDGVKPLEVVDRLARAGVDYTFVRIDASTDMMVEKFSAAYAAAAAAVGDAAGVFTVVDLKSSQARDAPAPVVVPVPAPAWPPVVSLGGGGGGSGGGYDGPMKRRTSPAAEARRLERRGGTMEEDEEAHGGMPPPPPAPCMAAPMMLREGAIGGGGGGGGYASAAASASAPAAELMDMLTVTRSASSAAPRGAPALRSAASPMSSHYVGALGGAIKSSMLRRTVA